MSIEPERKSQNKKNEDTKQISDISNSNNKEIINGINGTKNLPHKFHLKTSENNPSTTPQNTNKTQEQKISFPK